MHTLFSINTTRTLSFFGRRGALRSILGLHLYVDLPVVREAALRGAEVDQKVEEGQEKEEEGGGHFVQMLHFRDNLHILVLHEFVTSQQHEKAWRPVYEEA